MIAILSPAKTLDYSGPLPDRPASTPRFAEDAATIARGAARLSVARLSKLMHISDKLAALNAGRFRGFDDAPSRPALFAFAGDVYRGFEAASLEPEAIAFAQDHVRILSGLYGLLRPLDAMRPYRLEMGTRWAPGRARDLYAYWQDRIAREIAADADAAGTDTILNLASQEYWGAVAGRLPARLRVIEVDFRRATPDGPQFVSFDAKRARGMMARWMCEHRVTDVDAMRGFDSDGYRFDTAASTDDAWRFVRGAGA
ncbi:peroxide stress protein YaaA [Sphingomonas sp. SFZ2018-12]|uniref:peroxide stress protein YaaA n=1 Tax=Sphingomonas sp. SFZ2018-12 TaxID=2683197 RepID=UPI001F0E843C|nr:peroxide stress protein YaaA [Sphingomonas sp. SFZ2018-12]MCH4892670.1 peroxide stress protein YaaA [Sphingomonas sp. SFZ2018-12]